ncbi:hypothetical protein CTI12_AA015680 [Artemisia annua]|uniref:Uncharacterized protein n=1 Tax=Artemisia annua TaxID=35608 RepID=A0A2U1QL29_ARTAN|nr:hypothetical protein CTI12_AA015680 [Artemisia annua]
MGISSYEVGWVQMGLIFSKHRILDRFLLRCLVLEIVVEVEDGDTGGNGRWWCKKCDLGGGGGG